MSNVETELTGKSKLTLRLSTDSIAKGKALAEQRGISLSRLVEHYFEILSQTSDDSTSDHHQISERTRYLVGILKDDSNSGKKS
jgi:hypothetical protein